MTAGTYQYTEKSDGIKEGAIFDVTGGTFIFGDEMRNGHTYKYEEVCRAAIFPDRPNKTLVVDSNNSGADPIKGNNLALGSNQDIYRLAGTLVVTNVADNAASNGRVLSMTNATYYGGGTIVANQFLRGRDQDLPQHLELSRLELGDGLPPYGKTIVSLFMHGATTLAGWKDWKRDSSTLVNIIPDGVLTVETDDCRTGEPRNLQIPSLKIAEAGSTIAVTGSGTADIRMAARQIQNPLVGLSVGDGASLAISNHRDYQGVHWIKDFFVGAGAEVTVPFKCLNSASNISISCISSSRIAADAKVTALCDYSSAAPNAEAIYHIYTAAPGSEWPDPAQWTLKMNGVPENPDSWEMRVVGPTVYLTDGKALPSTSNAHWTGAESGLFSDARNWSNNAQPTASGSLWLVGNQRTVVTNDLASVGGKGVRTENKTGPFVVRGNQISVTRSSTGFEQSYAAISHKSSMPLIFENKITGTVAEFWIANDGSSYIAFMNKEALALANKPIHLRGRVIIGGEAKAKNLYFEPHWNSINESMVAVVGDGSFTLTDQTAAFTNSAVFSVGAGTTFTISGGSFRYARTELTHRVDGLMDLQVPFSAGSDTGEDAVVDIGFSGMGVVQFASVKSSTLGSSQVKAMGGVTLSPAGNWTTVTADAANTYLGITVPDWGKAKLAPRGDFNYGPAAGVVATTDTAVRSFTCGDFSELTIDSNYAVAFSDPLIFGQHAKLIKKGTGRMQVSAVDVLPETVKVEAGTLALSAPETIANFITTNDASIEFAAGASLKVTEYDVNLDGLTIIPPENTGAWTSLITVAELRAITGTPTFTGGDYSMKLVNNPDGTTSMAIKPRSGTILYIR